MQNENSRFRIYRASDSIVFGKTNEKFGGLSNMAPGFPLYVNGNIISNEIISQNSPMTAKMISKKYHDKSRQDWEQIRVRVMRWCLEVKLCQKWERFGSLLGETKTKPIVEFSTKDQFWGASKSKEDNGLTGQNALGRLLMELRGKYILTESQLGKVAPPNVTGFLLYGYETETIYDESRYAIDADDRA